jgi:VNT family MFS transporter (synaptic vesicle glycoprotein 2)
MTYNSIHLKTIKIYSVGRVCLKLESWKSFSQLYASFFPCRATGFGFLNALCKAAAVLGNLIFGSLVSITKAIPILLASTVLVCGGLVGLRLPDTRTQVLM